ncbi:glutamine amidotransferase [Acetobacter orientalis]|uniref:Glutamine amidotransferase n=1 Tax=Acetobacter orientalis TaxID=146474 RepID=A0A2Z5ZHX4_9PROT|nr:glutamine amidotransferase [Acetobacter orientalis]
MTARRPVIGITLDHEPGGEGRYSRFAWYALRENYMSAVTTAGGLPVALPLFPQLAADYMPHIDGLLITGGAFDIDPSLYGDTTQHETVNLRPRRTQTESAYLSAALAQNKPVLGICGGMQLMAVALGAPLFNIFPIRALMPCPTSNPTQEMKPATQPL